MGGAEDLPKRASSPLKRPAADLEPEDSSNHTEDVDMILVPASGSPQSAKPNSKSPRTERAQSINMLENEAKSTTSGEADIPEKQTASRPKSPASGM